MSISLIRIKMEDAVNKQLTASFNNKSGQNFFKYTNHDMMHRQFLLTHKTNNMRFQATVDEYDLQENFNVYNLQENFNVISQFKRYLITYKGKIHLYDMSSTLNWLFSDMTTSDFSQNVVRLLTVQLRFLR